MTSGEKTIRRRVAPVAGALMISLGLLLSGCTGSPSTGSGATQTEDAQKEISLPTTELGKSSSWVIQQLNGSGDLNVEEWKKKLAERITKEMPAKQLVGVIESDVRKKGPFKPTKFSEAENVATTRIVGKGGVRFDMVLSVDDSGQFNGIHFTPVN